MEQRRIFARNGLKKPETFIYNSENYKFQKIVKHLHEFWFFLKFQQFQQSDLSLHISFQYSLLLTPENIRKPIIFWFCQGRLKGNIEKNRVNRLSRQHQNVLSPKFKYWKLFVFVYTFFIAQPLHTTISDLVWRVVFAKLKNPTFSEINNQQRPLKHKNRLQNE